MLTCWLRAVVRLGTLQGESCSARDRWERCAEVGGWWAMSPAWVLLSALGGREVAQLLLLLLFAEGPLVYRSQKRGRGKLVAASNVKVPWVRINTSSTQTAKR